MQQTSTADISRVLDAASGLLTTADNTLAARGRTQPPAAFADTTTLRRQLLQAQALISEVRGGLAEQPEAVR